MAASKVRKVLRFDRYSEEELEWLADEAKRKDATEHAERKYASILLLWSGGRAWLGLAKVGSAGPYAIAIRRFPDQDDSTRYIPREQTPREQPRTPQEAVAAVRAEEAREIALFGEPDLTRNAMTVTDGDPQKVADLGSRIRRVEDRHFAEWAFVSQFRVLRLLWGPFYRWRRRRFMRKEWTA